jgi:poly(3-hydroxyalkanoate) synthetase
MAGEAKRRDQEPGAARQDAGTVASSPPEAALGVWLAWLGERSGKKVAPPSMGSEAHPPLADAPGTYVLEK